MWQKKQTCCRKQARVQELYKLSSYKRQSDVQIQNVVDKKRRKELKISFPAYYSPFRQLWVANLSDTLHNNHNFIECIEQVARQRKNTHTYEICKLSVRYRIYLAIISLSSYGMFYIIAVNIL
jgi:protein gp37